MAGTIASLLADFSNPVTGAPSGINLLRTVKVSPDPSPEPPQPVVDRQAELIKSVEARVRTEEREIARRELEDALAAEKDRHIEDLSEQRAIWVEQQAAQVSDQISKAIERIEADLSERVANILRPFVSEAFRQQTLAEFEDVLATLLSGRNVGALKVSGPEDLLLAVKSHLGRYENLVEFIPGEQVEIGVSAQDTFVQTQLNSWSVKLAQVLEG